MSSTLSLRKEIIIGLVIALAFVALYFFIGQDHPMGSVGFFSYLGLLFLSSLDLQQTSNLYALSIASKWQAFAINAITGGIFFGTLMGFIGWKSEMGAQQIAVQVLVSGAFFGIFTQALNHFFGAKMQAQMDHNYDLTKPTPFYAYFAFGLWTLILAVGVFALPDQKIHWMFLTWALSLSGQFYPRKKMTKWGRGLHVVRFMLVMIFLYLCYNYSAV